MVKHIENKFASVKIHKIAFTKGLGLGLREVTCHLCIILMKRASEINFAMAYSLKCISGKSDCFLLASSFVFVILHLKKLFVLFAPLLLLLEEFLIIITITYLKVFYKCIVSVS